MTTATLHSTPELSVELKDTVLWLTITREERRNAVNHAALAALAQAINCLLYTSPSPRDYAASRMPSSA